MKLLVGICKLWDTASLRQRRIVHVVLLVLIGAAVYSNSLDAPFVFDDHYSIDFYGKQNLLEHLFNGTQRRVADITFAVNYRIHGLQVAGYHLTNLAIHLATSILLYFLVVSAISALKESYAAKKNTAEQSYLMEQFIPFAIAMLFVCHPVQTQAVTYIIQRYTSLATFFYLLSSFLYIRFRLASIRCGFNRNSWLLGGGNIAAGLLAVGSKQIAFTLPFMLTLLELFLFRGRLFNRRCFVVSAVLFFIALIAVSVLWHGSSGEDLLLALRLATSEDPVTSRTTYFLTQTRVVATYLRLLCFPVGQSLVHDSPLYSSLFALPVAASLALHSLIVATAALLFRWSGQNLTNDAWQRGVFQRLASLGIFWFYCAMAVESSLFPIRDVINEHRIYLPSAGFFMTITAVTALAVQGRKAGMKVAWTLFVAVCLLLGSMTIARNRVWNDPLSLWQEAASKSPHKSVALVNLACEYNGRKMPEKALPLYVRAMELNPDLFFRSKVGLGETLHALNMNGFRFTTGQEFILPGGILGSGVIDVNNKSRWDSVISNNMGLAYEYLHELEKAKKAYKSAVAMNPVYDRAWLNLALLASRLGDNVEVDEAQRRLQTLNQPMARELAIILKSAILR